MFLNLCSWRGIHELLEIKCTILHVSPNVDFSKEKVNPWLSLNFLKNQELKKVTEEKIKNRGLGNTKVKDRQTKKEARKQQSEMQDENENLFQGLHHYCQNSSKLNCNMI